MKKVKMFLLKLLIGKDNVVFNIKLINGTIHIDNDKTHAYLYNVYVDNSKPKEV